MMEGRTLVLGRKEQGRIVWIVAENRRKDDVDVGDFGG